MTIRLLFFLFALSAGYGCDQGSAAGTDAPRAAESSDSVATAAAPPDSPASASQNFFEKPYFTGQYDFGEPFTDHPFQEYFNRDGTGRYGYVCIHFLPRTSAERAFWDIDNPALRGIAEHYDDGPKKASILRPYVENRWDEFVIVAEAIPQASVRYATGNSEEFYLVEDARVEYHRYDGQTKTWYLVRTSPTRIFSTDTLTLLAVLSPAKTKQQAPPNNMERLEAILLNRYLAAGVGAGNILQPSTKQKIERVVNALWNADDFNSESFYTRKESNLQASAQMLRDWHAILKQLDFSEIGEEEREADWREPFHHVRSLQPVYRLYDNAGYGDGWQYITRAMTDHMALYILYSSPGKRAGILRELADVRKHLFRQSGER